MEMAYGESIYVLNQTLKHNPFMFSESAIFQKRNQKMSQISPLIPFSVIFIGFIEFPVSFRVKINQPGILPYLSH